MTLKRVKREMLNFLPGETGDVFGSGEERHEARPSVGGRFVVLKAAKGQRRDKNSLKKSSISLNVSCFKTSKPL